MTVTTANSPSFDKISKVELEKLQNRLKINRQKQSKLTDAYLENLLSEELYKQKNEGLRAEEEELTKRIALQELREVERERLKDYVNRVEEFILGYSPKQKELSLDQEKQVARLLFKNIKIAPAIGGSLPPKRISFSFFAPFNFLFSETEKKLQGQKNQKVIKKCPKKSTFALSADPWFVLYKLAKPFFFTAFQVELAE